MSKHTSADTAGITRTVCGDVAGARLLTTGLTDYVMKAVQVAPPLSREQADKLATLWQTSTYRIPGRHERAA
jgi:hypothetical protein